jgi:deazaflavin-dependent oxidoreductase (nitroreductase family)
MARTLAERLARVSDRSTLRLTHRGRKSGKAYVVTIWFVVDEETVYLGTMNRERQWVRNVLQTPRVRLDMGGEHFDGDVTPITAHKKMVAAYDLFARKYWVMWALDWMAALVRRNPRTTKDYDFGSAAFFRVELKSRT